MDCFWTDHLQKQNSESGEAGRSVYKVHVSMVRCIHEIQIRVGTRQSAGL